MEHNESVGLLLRWFSSNNPTCRYRLRLGIPLERMAARRLVDVSLVEISRDTKTVIIERKRFYMGKTSAAHLTTASYDVHIYLHKPDFSSLAAYQMAWYSRASGICMSLPGYLPSSILPLFFFP